MHIKEISQKFYFSMPTKVRYATNYCYNVHQCTILFLYRYYSSLVCSIPAAEACDALRRPDIDAIDIRREGRRGGVSSSLLSLLGSIIALSSAYGRPRCRPRIYISTQSKRHDIPWVRSWQVYSMCEIEMRRMRWL